LISKKEAATWLDFGTKVVDSSKKHSKIALVFLE